MRMILADWKKFFKSKRFQYKDEYEAGWDEDGDYEREHYIAKGLVSTPIGKKKVVIEGYSDIDRSMSGDAEDWDSTVIKLDGYNDVEIEYDIDGSLGFKAIQALFDKKKFKQYFKLKKSRTRKIETKMYLKIEKATTKKDVLRLLGNLGLNENMYDPELIGKWFATGKEIKRKPSNTKKRWVNFVTIVHGRDSIVELPAHIMKGNGYVEPDDFQEYAI